MEELIKVRTVTYFISRQCISKQDWETELTKAASFLRQAQSLLESQGEYLLPYEDLGQIDVLPRLACLSHAGDQATKIRSWLENLPHVCRL